MSQALAEDRCFVIETCGRHLDKRDIALRQCRESCTRAHRRHTAYRELLRAEDDPEARPERLAAACRMSCARRWGCLLVPPGIPLDPWAVACEIARGIDATAAEALGPEEAVNDRRGFAAVLGGYEVAAVVAGRDCSEKAAWAQSGAAACSQEETVESWSRQWSRDSPRAAWRECTNAPLQRCTAWRTSANPFYRDSTGLRPCTQCCCLIVSADPPAARETHTWHTSGLWDRRESDRFAREGDRGPAPRSD